MAQAGPEGWYRGLVEHREQRFADDATLTPLTYNEQSRTVDAVLSKGSPVPRFYGTEVLRIDPQSVIIDRLIAGGIPLLDSHQQIGISNALGRVTRVWFERGNALMGRLQFNETPQGEAAMGMVARGEISGISAGYKVEEWEISNADGDILDPEIDRVRWDDDLTFTATRWELLEASLVLVGADSAASVRSLGGRNGNAYDARTRMAVRQRMIQRQRMFEAQQIVFGNADD